MRTRALVAIVLAEICLRPAFACYCDPAIFDASDGTVRRAYKDADIVLLGTVKSLHVADNAPGGGGVVATFDIQESWKGPSSGTLDVGTVASDCRFDFENGESYLLYAFPDANGAFTTVCTRTQPVDRAANDLKVLQRDRPHTFASQ